MTNGDKWRSMSDEQIAEIIQRDGCCSCPAADKTGDCELATMAFDSEEECNKACKRAIVKWLKQETRCHD